MAVYQALCPMFKRIMDFPDLVIDCLFALGRFSASRVGMRALLESRKRNFWGDLSSYRH